MKTRTRKVNKAVDPPGDIAAQQQTEALLRQTQARLARAQRLGRLGYWEWDIQNQTLLWSDEVYRIFGVGRDLALTYENIAGLLHPEDRETNTHNVQSLLTTTAEVEFEFRIIRPQGEIRHIVQTAQVERDAAGQPLHIFGILQDVTERRRIEQALRRSRSELATVYERAPVMMCLLGPGREVLYANRAFTAFTGVPEAELVQGRACGVFGCINAQEHPDGCGFGERCRDCQLRLAIEDTLATGQGHRDVEYRATLERAGVRRDVVLLGATARIESSESPRVLLCLEDITERKRAEKELQVSLEKYHVLFEAFPLGITVSDAQGVVVEANRASEQLLGLSTREHAGRTIDGEEWSIIRLDGAPMPADEYASVRALRENRRVENVEMGIVKGADDVTWISVTAAPIPLEGYGVAVAYGDISERVRSQAALRESEARYRLLIEGIRDSIYVLDREWRHVVVNDAATRFTGIPREQLLGSKLTDLFPGIEHTDFFQTFRRVMETRVPGIVSTEYAFQDGRKGWYEVSVYPIQGGILCISRDITKRKQAEEALSAERLLLRAVIESIPEGVYVKDVESRFLIANEQSVRYLGTRPDQIIGETDAAYLPPELARQYYTEEQAIITTGKPLINVEAPVMDPAGNEHWFSTSKVPFRNSQGQIIGIVGIGRDITEYKKVEEALRQSREQLRALASYLQSAQEKERTHIAREVHDELGQALTALKIDLAWLNKRLSKDKKTALANKVEDMLTLVDDTIRTVRQMATELRPGMLDDLGLVAALEWQVAEFARRTGLTCRADLDQEALEEVLNALDRDLVTAIFRIGQEALTNVARHAQATEVAVSLRRAHGVLVLTVHDNGIGLAPNVANGANSLGLLGMRERALAWQGSVTFDSVPGQGTTVTLRAPLQTKESQ